MANKEDWLRGIGMGLMGGVKQFNENRRMAAEEQRQANLLAIAEGRQGLMREELDFMKDRQAATDKRLATQDTRLVAGNQDKAIGEIQKRLDALKLDDPENMAKREYYMMRQQAVKDAGGLDADPEALKETLDTIKQQFYADREAGLIEGTPEYKAAQAEAKRYIDEVESFFKTAENRMARVEGWDGDLSSVLFMSPTMEEGLESREPLSPEEERMQAEYDFDAASQAGGETTVGPVPPDRGLMDTQDWPTDRSPSAEPFSGVGRLFESIGITKTKPFDERMRRARKAYGLEIDPVTGDVKAPSVQAPTAPQPSIRRPPPR